MTMKKLAALLLSLVMLFTCLVSAMAEETVTTPESTEAVESEAAEEEADPVLAYVNGEPLTLSFVSGYVSYIIENYFDSDTDLDEETMRTVNAAGMENAIGYTLLKQKAAEHGLTEIGEEEMAQLRLEAEVEWNDMVLYYAEAYFGYSEEATDEENAAALVETTDMLEGYGYTLETMIEDEINNHWYDAIIAEICADVKASDDDAYAAFLAQVEEDRGMFEGNVMMYELYGMYYGYDSCYIPEGYRGVKQILLSVDEELLTAWSDLETSLNSEEEGVTQEQVDAAKSAVIASVQETIDTINARLAAGESFDALITEYNTDPGMNEEPYKTDGYTVSAESITFDQSFVDAAFSVNSIGEVSAPFVGSYGIYIVQYVRDVPAGAVAYTDEIKATMMETVQSERESEAVLAAVQGWEEEAEIIYTEDGADYKPVEPDAAIEATETDVE